MNFNSALDEMVLNIGTNRKTVLLLASTGWVLISTSGNSYFLLHLFHVTGSGLKEIGGSGSRLLRYQRSCNFTVLLTYTIVFYQRDLITYNKLNNNLNLSMSRLIFRLR